MTAGTMTGIDYFAWFVLIVIVVSLVYVFIALARLPGQIAKKRGHPQAEAINVAGWLGLLLTLGVVWALAMIWAFTKPAAGSEQTTSAGDEIAQLEARIAKLEGKLDQATEASS